MIILVRQKGFTLIESVVAVMLLAVMSVMAYQAVDVVIDANDRSQDRLAEEVVLQKAWQVLANDILHLRARTYADGLGGMEGAYETGRYNALVNFTRGGGPILASNPTGLSRIQYQLNTEQELVRTSWPVFASPRQHEGNSRVLLSGVQAVFFEQLGEDTYRPNWPPLNVEQSPLVLPRMIRVTITLEDGTSTRRLFPGVENDVQG